MVKRGETGFNIFLCVLIFIMLWLMAGPILGIPELTDVLGMGKIK